MLQIYNNNKSEFPASPVQGSCSLLCLNLHSSTLAQLAHCRIAPVNFFSKYSGNNHPWPLNINNVDYGAAAAAEGPGRHRIVKKVKKEPYGTDACFKLPRLF